MKKTGPDISGFLLINKPQGLTSFDVIRRLKRITGISKIGHTGTLDPFATGLMVYCINRYTRIANLLEKADKSYKAVMVFGSATDTGDNTGTVVQTAPVDIDESMVQTLPEAILQLSNLHIQQYSAVKIDGKRAYEYARNNVTVEIPDRDVKIHSFELIQIDPQSLEYRCKVSKGTYIRSLSEWIARYLGTEGHTVELTRESIGDIALPLATDLADINEDNWQAKLFPAIDLLRDFEPFEADQASLNTMFNGQSIASVGIDNPSVIVYDAIGSVRCIAFRKDGALCPKMNLG
ncbi:MAG: tRNA pseudouridine(55) synthase TruB [Candidatus Cloacimonetes bacterium HGW-Cloacimonetes-1]|jgi:tRNA pseudouridine55 synthase|nr:MAG: tRNA pseudouridine(55) synthase TruB [Candidatus Cloacimonetes bacterium HGW-Cloacimonetes-1]